jgi:hypothetical protein
MLMSLQAIPSENREIVTLSTASQYFRPPNGFAAHRALGDALATSADKEISELTVILSRGVATTVCSARLKSTP